MITDRELENMVSLRGGGYSGVDNTVFISTDGYGQPVPYIAVAIDPPDSLNAGACNAMLMCLNGFILSGSEGFLTDETQAPLDIVDQAREFVENNQQTLLDYWNLELATDELIWLLKRRKVQTVHVKERNRL